MTGDRGFQVRALGEIAIRCRDIAAMERFYRDIIGLSVLSGGHREGIVFFTLGESFGGHSAVLALFAHDATQRAMHPEDAGAPVTGARSSLHHLALALPASEQAAAEAWFRTQGIACHIEHFDWIGWRGLFVQDPEGNTVELVAKVKDPVAPETA